MFRYPVAIKCPKSSTNREIDEFLEEAKSMLEINAYHDNIVNLQGMTYINSNDSIVEVCYLKVSILFEMYLKGKIPERIK